MQGICQRRLQTSVPNTPLVGSYRSYEVRHFDVSMDALPRSATGALGRLLVLLPNLHLTAVQILSKATLTPFSYRHKWRPRKIVPILSFPPHPQTLFPSTVMSVGATFGAALVGLVVEAT